MDVDGEVKELKIGEMCLSRIYSALTSPISIIKVANQPNQAFLFVSSQIDECILKYKITSEDPKYCYEHQPYMREGER